MKTEQKQVTMTILTAAKGKWLTQVADVDKGSRVFSQQVYLGSADAASNWKEVTNTFKETFEAEKNAEETPAEPEA